MPHPEFHRAAFSTSHDVPGQALQGYMSISEAPGAPDGDAAPPSGLPDTYRGGLYNGPQCGLRPPNTY